MHAQPQKEHEWLHKLVGNWTSEIEASMGPDQPNMKWSGKENVRSLGGLWTISEGQGDMPGGGIGYFVMTLGFDPTTNRFVGTFIGSMMTHLWIYKGASESSEREIILDAEGPDFTQTKMTMYCDTITWIDDDHRKLVSKVLGDDGQWKEFMWATYRRVK